MATKAIRYEKLSRPAIAILQSLKSLDYHLYPFKGSWGSWENRKHANFSYSSDLWKI